MGSFSNSTVQVDGGGNDRGSSGSGNAYNPKPVSELYHVVHTLEWIPGSNEAVVTESCDPAGDIVDGGIGISLQGGVCEISGSYIDLFPTVYTEWTLPPPDEFTAPEYHSGVGWSDIPPPESCDLTRFDCHPTQDKSGTYTYTVNWVNTSNGATGADVVVLEEQVYMDFWLHEQEAAARSI